MRPQKAWSIVDKAISAALNGDVTKLNSSQTRQALVKLLDKLKVDLAESYELHYNSYKPDPSTYRRAYYELMYISDRFNAPHRIKWLIFGIDNHLFTADNVANRDDYDTQQMEKHFNTLGTYG